MIPAAIPENEQERLADLISLNLSSDAIQQQFNGVILILSRCLKVPIAYISSIESDIQKIHSSCGLNFKSSPRETSFCGHTILQNHLVIIEDTLKDPRFYDNPMVIDKPFIRFYAGYPLSGKMGNNIGSLCIADIVPRRLNAEDLKIFKMIGKLLNERIEMSKLVSLQTAIQDSQEHLEVLNKQLSESNQFYKEIFGQYMSESLLDKVISNKKQTKIGGERTGCNSFN